MNASRDHAQRDDLDDIVDFDAFGADPELARAIQDAEHRSALRATLIAQRKAAGLKQKDVAVAMQTTQSAVSDFERGGTDPQLSTLQRYARAVGARVVVRACIESPAKGPEGAWLANVATTGYQRVPATVHPIRHNV
jgi:DNA-binding XRE family transcriptional regulator